MSSYGRDREREDLKGGILSMVKHKIIHGVVAHLPLANGEFAIIDKEDYYLCSKYKWNVNAEGFVTTGSGTEGTFQSLHILLGPPINCGGRLDKDGNPVSGGVDKGKGTCQVIIHVNKNMLDNRRVNLRAVDQNQNLARVGIQKNNTSGYKGVSWDKARDKWSAKFCYNYKQINIGRYDTPEEAALAYNQVARSLLGEYAYQNDVE